MKIIIDISEDEYQRTMRHYEQFPRDLSRYERRIIDGTPLEQEPKTDVLDKIRAEIANHCGLVKENRCRYCSYCRSLMGIREILEIIDKYMAEGSDKE